MTTPIVPAAARPPPPTVRDGSGWWDVTIGIITALPVEGAAMTALITEPTVVRVDGDPNDYRVGYLASADVSTPHRVVLTTMPLDNTRNAAATCANLLRTFTGVRCVVVTGVAGGIPSLDRPERHVRLGDVVVAVDGIIDYGHLRLVDGAAELRRPVDGISVELLRAARELELRAYQDGVAQLSRWLAPADGHLGTTFARPSARTDRLYIDGKFTRHPERAISGHVEGVPKIHYGAIGCADVLLRDEHYRDELASKHRIMAVEMEGSGVAAGAMLHGVGWFMVRGVADYCDNLGKNQRWHPHASITAAAYVCALLESCRAFAAGRTPPSDTMAALVSAAERNRLFDLLEQAPRMDLRKVWRAALSDLVPLPTPAPVTVYELFDYLAGVNAGHDGMPPALMFVEEIATRVTDPLGTALHGWVDQIASSTHIIDVVRRRRRAAAEARDRHRGSTAVTAGAADLSPAAPPCIVIQLEIDGLDHSRCIVSYWIQHRTGPWRPRATTEPTRVLLSEAERVVDTAILDAETAWRDSLDPVSVEFLLPTDLLHLAVEWWRVNLGSTAPVPLCVGYPVVVRSLDRMRALFRRRAWINRWNALWHDPPSHRVFWGGTPEVANGIEQWNARLHGDTSVTSVVLSAAPQNETGKAELDLALSAGVPVVLWDRREIAREQMVAGMVELMRGHPNELLDRIRALRVEAASGSGADQQHPGRHVAVLWDDPRRLIGAEGRADD
ncbi:MAG TPA: hypothetical protein VFM55_03025 [Micromonosporaceae bacterium]|nr:hypothetical protein [Micromonosporaceae bacterium]